MSSNKKDFDELPEKRSERSIPLNVETILVEGAREPKQFNPADENEKLKKDDSSDLDTIRGDLETPEPVVPGTKRNPEIPNIGKNKKNRLDSDPNYGDAKE
jgi:hypothetical protein